eukprot:6194533-Pleurochrysis_carterae.AAC.1
MEGWREGEKGRREGRQKAFRDGEGVRLGRASIGEAEGKEAARDTRARARSCAAVVISPYSIEYAPVTLSGLKVEKTTPPMMMGRQSHLASEKDLP